jgi:hypothetical protein
VAIGHHRNDGKCREAIELVLPTDQSRVDKIQTDCGCHDTTPSEVPGPRAGRRRRIPAMSGRPNPVGVLADFLRKRLGAV